MVLFKTYKVHSRNLFLESCSIFFGLLVECRIFIKYYIFGGFTQMKFLLFSQCKKQF